jgi:hypothetical protein
MIFASTGLILEREPPQWGDFLGYVVLWVQNAGAVAALGLFIFMLAQLVRRRHPLAGIDDRSSSGRAGGLASLGVGLASLSFLGYLFIAFIGIANVSGGALANLIPRAGQRQGLSLGDYLLALSGGLALVLALTPMFLNMLRLRWGRIWALARLSLKEAVRSRVVLVFGAMAVVFLFADWFVPYKAEDQVRNYVRVVYWSIMPLFLMMAGLLGALSIPADIKNQSIHTIVTKPVEKFEIVLGRFLGYAVLLTTGLAVISVLSLVYVIRGINEDAAKESFKARVPVFGDLGFVGSKGDSVGREFDYRRYISGPNPQQQNAPRQFAVWSFADVPSDLATRDGPSRFEFTFDIFRLSKGEENKGLFCTFTFVDGNMSIEQVNGLVTGTLNDERNRLQTEAGKERDRQREKAKGDPAALEKVEGEYLARLSAMPAEIIQNFRVYEAAGIEVTDYHTQSVEVPAAFFKMLADGKGGKIAAGAPAMRVLVSVDQAREAQMLGAARRDFYLLAAERPFWQNFLKGIVGMWCTFMLVLGVAIACSTYLSGIISWLCTMFLFLSGMFNEYFQQLAENRMEGGGPSEAVFRLATRHTLNAPLDASPTVSVLKGTDLFFSWWLRRLLNLIPDVNRFDLHHYVANGFDISWTQILLLDNVIMLIGYLVPWAILAFYLMKFREVANPN